MLGMLYYHYWHIFYWLIFLFFFSFFLHFICFLCFFFLLYFLKCQELYGLSYLLIQISDTLLRNFFFLFLNISILQSDNNPYYLIRYGRGCHSRESGFDLLRTYVSIHSVEMHFCGKNMLYNSRGHDRNSVVALNFFSSSKTFLDSH